MTDNPVRKGIVYKNVNQVVSYTDRLLPKEARSCRSDSSRRTWKRNNGKKDRLEKLDDSEEQEANSYIFHRFVKNEG